MVLASYPQNHTGVVDKATGEFRCQVCGQWHDLQELGTNHIRPVCEQCKRTVWLEADLKAEEKRLGDDYF